MSNKAASEDALGELHAAVTVGLTAILQEGVPVVDSEGSISTAPAPASYYAAAIAMLKNNNITASKSGNKSLQDLAAAIKARKGRSRVGADREAEAAAEAFAQIAGVGSFQ